MPRTRVTPEQAQKWLDNSANKNRPISEATVKRYADEMTNDTWAYTGETIIFDKKGGLVNGHHRLRACVMSGMSFDVEIVTGIDYDEAFSKIDTGKSRNASDRMAIRGEDKHAVMGPAVSWLAKLSDPRFAFGGKYRVTAEMENQMLEKYPEIRGSVSFIHGDNFFKKTIRNVPMMAALHTLFGRHDAKARDKFFVALREGTALASGSSALLLRDRLIAEGANNRSTILKKAYIAGLTIKAFNYFASGNSLDHLKLSPGEDFPEIGAKPTRQSRYNRRSATGARAREKGIVAQ